MATVFHLKVYSWQISEKKKKKNAQFNLNFRKKSICLLTKIQKCRISCFSCDGPLSWLLCSDIC